ncbi:MAG TPA: DNA repair protein RecN [Rhodopila sp.]|uniref:DNA repair protein RecN n=1 Tax=Rhodopila sp. TaxID=2480087 RepID=UPI002BD9F08F|nr:DNA repair protein RecN [Rhodopila sp.]HVY18199.1 DNA repair protein RecN [Rhodopila sp.]
MLTTLSIRDVVLIDRLDLSFEPGLTVLTGETGAGKSILLDSLGLALGARAETGLVRTGADQASVTACFTPPDDHGVNTILQEQGLAIEDEIVLRRIVNKDGRSRAFVNDQPVGIALLRRIGEQLVEVQGQHEQMSLADPTRHGALLDAFGGLGPECGGVNAAWRAWQEAVTELDGAREAIAAAERDEEWLRHAVDELAKLAPQPNEEDTLAAERQRLQQHERRGEAIAAALAELTPRDRRAAGPAAALRAAVRSLQRLVPANQPETQNPAESALVALERAEEALAEAETLLTRLAADSDLDPRLLEQAEERLFALRAAARKHGVAVAELSGLLDSLTTRLAELETGAAHIEALEQAARQTRQAYVDAARALSAARQDAAGRLRDAVTAELPPLRLDKARFFVDVADLPEASWSPNGVDQVRFLIATNPGQEPGPLARIASGGELSRLMLAMKVVLSAGSAVPTLVFDEVDSGIGGATAAAVGERLARVAEQLQVLVVTHSPQVAARGSAHLRVAKQTARDRTATTVQPLKARDRREEIARMLAGETVSDAARAAADDLLRGQRPPQGLLV